MGDLHLWSWATSKLILVNNYQILYFYSNLLYKKNKNKIKIKKTIINHMNFNQI